jgi:hypothetical protein
MAHEKVKQFLQQARTLEQRTEAIREAISDRMPLNEIEAYLDWLDAVRRLKPPDDSGESGPPPSPPAG